MRNYRCRYGEIDIVAQEGEEVVFVEVKGGRGDGFGHPAERFDARKLSRVIACAYAFMEEAALEGNFRIDLIVVCGNDLQHFRNVGFD